MRPREPPPAWRWPGIGIVQSLWTICTRWSIKNRTKCSYGAEYYLKPMSRQLCLYPHIFPISNSKIRASKGCENSLSPMEFNLGSWTTFLYKLQVCGLSIKNFGSSWNVFFRFCWNVMISNGCEMPQKPYKRSKVYPTRSLMSFPLIWLGRLPRYEHENV